MEGEISGAIRAKRVLNINYSPGNRTIEPHTFGRGSDGQLLLRGYQISGASASGEPTNWKLFRVDQIAKLSVSEATFDGPRPGYKRGDKAMKNGVIAEL